MIEKTIRTDLVTIVVEGARHGAVLRITESEHIPRSPPVALLLSVPLLRNDVVKFRDALNDILESPSILQNALQELATVTEERDRAQRELSALRSTTTQVNQIPCQIGQRVIPTAGPWAGRVGQILGPITLDDGRMGVRVRFHNSAWSLQLPQDVEGSYDPRWLREANEDDTYPRPSS